MNKIVKKIFDVLFILIIIVLIGYFILRFNKIIEIYNVRTGSMEDDIHAGDYVLIVRKGNYEIGDVVTFRKDNYLVTHRIIKKNGDSFVTKGDANNDEDGPILFNQIVGKVVFIGGILNVIINYKFLLVSIFISLYLVSCYFLDKEDNILENKNVIDNDKETKIKEIENKDELVKSINDDEIIHEEDKIDIDNDTKKETKEKNKVEVKKNNITKTKVKNKKSTSKKNTNNKSTVKKNINSNKKTEKNSTKGKTANSYKKNNSANKSKNKKGKRQNNKSLNKDNK